VAARAADQPGDLGTASGRIVGGVIISAPVSSPRLLTSATKRKPHPWTGSMIRGARGLSPKAWRSSVITWVSVVSDTAVTHQISQ
jgi:hypothetical protein